MIKTRHLPALSMLLLLCLAGCQTVKNPVSTLFPTGTSSKGEVQWTFAARDGDVIFITLQEGTRTIVAQELLPTPGAKHVPFDLVPAKADFNRCAQGVCVYQAGLRRGEEIIASGNTSFLGLENTIIPLHAVGTMPGSEPDLPAPVYE